MNITGTGVAIALAVALALAFLLYGAQVYQPFEQGVPEAAMLEVNPENINTMNPEELPTELSVSDVVEGTGPEAKAGDTVTVNYVGALPDGTIFDASAKHGKPFSFTLGAGQVISGWDQGLVGMKVGGKRRLVIPPDMAYGNQAVGDVIPANATLLFEVELVGVQ
ncbi:FKBP-type peptidyl-prolyl cis-trans isomerase [Patescibacteria group bacterium]|nr:FKBP-type peptidyl-prolyl cis-trans isomerase [Patescibacteria group bacterium]MBU2158700.1 FKBP-type peptidyl-prolyl cis-trans isomerase [Patescibacteria group bacterium]MBU2220373.1 FKBP-type peptidyl-prolyl cis-trans isomerase [Patescibacteria group bacterium]